MNVLFTDKSERSARKTAKNKFQLKFNYGGSVMSVMDMLGQAVERQNGKIQLRMR